MLRKIVIALLAVASIGLVSPTMSLARASGGGGGGHGSEATSLAERFRPRATVRRHR